MENYEPNALGKIKWLAMETPGLVPGLNSAEYFHSVLPEELTDKRSFSSHNYGLAK